MAEYILTFLILCRDFVCIIRPEPAPAMVVVCVGDVIRDAVIHRVDNDKGVPTLIVIQSNCTTT